MCYAFTANKYGQQGRPADEHRFQIKYGSEFDRYHTIYFDRKGQKVTLMFGVHLEAGLFIAVDPRMHTPTWFSSSVEFKTRDVEAAAAKGWHGWQRERSEARRKQRRPEENLQTETVIGFQPDQFLRYVEFERVASGVDCGERLRLSDRIEKSVTEREIVLPGPERHPLELKLGLPASDILDIISGAFRLAAAVRGGVAEHHLERHLRRVPGVRNVRHIIEDGKPDFEVEYRRRPFLIECKNVLARTQQGSAEGRLSEDESIQGGPLQPLLQADAVSDIGCMPPSDYKSMGVPIRANRNSGAASQMRRPAGVECSG